LPCCGKQSSPDPPASTIRTDHAAPLGLGRPDEFQAPDQGAILVAKKPLCGLTQLQGRLHPVKSSAGFRESLDLVAIGL
jgi:hypothetical protein